MRIHVLGAGAWGTALAVSASQGASGHSVTLWARDPEQIHNMQAARCNARYLPDVTFPPTLEVQGGILSHLSQNTSAQDLLIVATPMSGLRSVLTQLRDCAAPVVWLCKGFEVGQGTSAGLMGHEVAAQVAPNLQVGVLSGPSFAQEVARGQPTALVAASAFAEVRQRILAALHNASLRVYLSDDVVGVEVGGAVKNVLAIATGLCDGMQLGLNARAALITRGLAEITRLGVALGARPETFMGLSGLGDLVLTATGDLSRNRKVGLLMAKGMALHEAVQSLGHVAEGVQCARTVVQRSRELGVEMPIAQSVVALLDGQLRSDEAVARLMQRGAKGET
jgi:glycerol-3-phosphate dehydrogenase (NAD(P)+)